MRPVVREDHQFLLLQCFVTEEKFPLLQYIVEVCTDHPPLLQKAHEFVDTKRAALWAFISGSIMDKSKLVPTTAPNQTQPTVCEEEWPTSNR